MIATTNQLTYDKLAKSGLRLCVVDDEYGWFHCWENYAEVIEPGIMIGSSPGGQFSRVYGVVEFNNGTERILPGKIKFVDDINSVLVGIRNETRNSENKNQEDKQNDLL